MKIDIYGYYKDHLNYSHQEILRELLGTTDYKATSMQTNRDTFSSELINIKPVTQECIDYMCVRGLTAETITKFKIQSCRGNIAFPYYKFETVVGYKLRKPMKNPPSPKLTSLTGSKPYLFNAQNIVMGAELIICEGEFDCMVIDQCGYSNVVSVGAGANSMTSLIEQSKEFLNSFESLIIVSDNDESGGNMDKTFVDLFKEKAKLIDKKLYEKNDINEEYIMYGKEKITKIIESARFKIEGRRDLDKTPYMGLTSITGKYIPTGLNSIDNAINDLAPGCVTLIAGRSNGGKTTLTKQIIANAIDKGNKVYLMSGEGNTEKLINEIYQCVIGRVEGYYNTIKINKKYHKEPKKEVLEALKGWHKGKLTIFNKGESRLKTIEQLFKMVEVEIKVNKFDLLVIDNLMSILSVQASEKMEAQADFLQRCHDLADLYHTHIILVLHPNKTYKKGDDMDFEQISGSSDISNKADNIISVIREYGPAEIANGISGKICVLKNRYYSDLATCNVHFEEQTGLLLEIDYKTNAALAYSFHWDKHMREVTATEQCPF
jgi:twinkle protein